MLRRASWVAMAIAIAIAIAMATATATAVAGSRAPASAANAPSPDRPDAALRQLLEATRLQERVPGITVAVATRQGVIWCGSVGYANLETRARAHPGYLYGIGSITKVFVASLVQQLIDEGRIGRDATALSILGPGPLAGIPNAERATIRELLNHTSGVPTWEFDADWMRRGRGAELLLERPWRKDETLDYIRGDRHPATNEPGLGYAYSNSNYTILGLVVEKVTGHDVLAELDARLFAPLRLADIHLEGFEPVDPARLPARYHYDTPEFRRTAGLHPSFRVVRPGLIDVSTSNLSTEWTAGGLVASAPDLARFTLALRDGHVVSAAALARMTTFRPTDEPGEEDGEGLFRERLDGASLIGYDGGVLGFGAVMGWFEREDLVVVVMTNVGSMHAGEAAFFPLRLVRSGPFVRAVRALAAALAPAGAPPGAAR